MGWSGCVVRSGWRWPGLRPGIFAKRTGAARIFAAALVPLVKRSTRCVTPRAMDAANAHGVTNLLRQPFDGNGARPRKIARPAAQPGIQAGFLSNTDASRHVTRSEIKSF
jgi:hypothetical protein